MNRRQRHRLAQTGVAFIVTALGIVTAIAILARGLDHPDFRAVIR